MERYNGAISSCAGNSRVLASWTSKRSSYYFLVGLDLRGGRMSESYGGLAGDIG